jgi:RNA polymerase sigma factor (TIGR02999 family)
MPGDITLLLKKWREGEDAAGDAVAPLVYDELRRVARRFLRAERPGHTLLSSDLVHEAYLRMIDQKQAGWQDRAHFFAIGARMMRRILVDHARARHSEKRGSGAAPVTLNEGLDAAGKREPEILALDEALDNLAQLDPRQSRIVELRFFAGLSIDETAEVLALSKATVNRDWVTARAWLIRELTGRPA